MLSLFFYVQFIDYLNVIKVEIFLLDTKISYSWFGHIFGYFWSSYILSLIYYSTSNFNTIDTYHF